MTKIFKIILAFIIVLLLVVGWFVFRSNRSDKSYFGADSGGTQTESQIESKAETNNEPSVYTHPTFGFNLNLPAGFRASNFAEGEGEMVMVSNSNNNFQMQIFITDYENENNITLAKIRRDIPNLQMESPQNVEAGGVPAVTFIDVERNNRELWFNKKGNLYQISSNPKDDQITGWIMERWSWE